MTIFRLQPCKVRKNRFVSDKRSQMLSLSWEEAVMRLAPSKSYKARLTLRNMKKGSYIGLLRSMKTPKAKPYTFFISNPGSNNNISWVLKKDPQFEKRVVDLFRVEDVDWDYSIEEFPTKPKDS